MIISAVIFGAASVVAIATIAVFLIARKLQAGNKLAVKCSGLFVPLFVAIVGSLGVFYDQEVDGPPPGMVLLGLLTMSAILMPITFSISLVLGRYSRCVGSAARDRGSNQLNL